MRQIQLTGKNLEKQVSVIEIAVGVCFSKEVRRRDDAHGYRQNVVEAIEESLCDLLRVYFDDAEITSMRG